MVKNNAKYNEVPLTAIQPRGWLLHYLENQRDGLTGHIEAAGFPYNTRAWMTPTFNIEGFTAWWPYEQTGYWIDGLVRCGYLLGDQSLISRAKEQIDYVLEHADSDGYLGPAFMKNPTEYNRWPHNIFFRACMAYASASGDMRVVPSLLRHYLSNSSPHFGFREVCNIEAMLWTYEQSGDARLLDQAIHAYQEYNRTYPKSDTSLNRLFSDRIASEHGVTYNETAKLGAILYIYTGNETYLQASINAYRKIDQHHMLVDGVNSSTEGLRGKDPLDSHETCDIADYTWSAGYLLIATGSAEYADKIERACFNAAPGAVTRDFKAMQYFSCPNQVIATTNSNHNSFFRGFDWMSYQPDPNVQCCVGELNRIMPNYTARMWMVDNAGGLVAALYGPSQMTAEVGSPRQSITIVEETNYPFSDKIDFVIHTSAPVHFPLSLRIPGWCQSARLLVNGESVAGNLRSSSFFTLTRLFKDGDQITLLLPMQIKTSRWPHGGISVERGPLVYALKIEEDWRIVKEETHHLPGFPAYNLYPASAWNYALDLDETEPQKDVEIIYHTFTDDPWNLQSAPIELRVPARRVLRWKLSKHHTIHSFYQGPEGLKNYKLKGDFTFTPQLPAAKSLAQRLGKKIVQITLVPYGCTKLRLTIFPYVR